MAKKKPASSSRREASALERLRPALMAIAAPQPPPIPADRLVAEAKLLARAARPHLAALRRAGLDGALIAELEERASALAEAQTALALARGPRRSEREIALGREAVVLRSRMVADGRFALRADEDARASLVTIQKGRSLDDLVQDLRALAAFATAHAAALSKIGAKPAVDAARALAVADGFEALVVARRAGDDGSSPDLRDLRDRAATHLYAAMAEVRTAGAHVFRDDPEALRAFRSAYLAQKRARARAKRRAAAAKSPRAGS